MRTARVYRVRLLPASIAGSDTAYDYNQRCTPHSEDIVVLQRWLLFPRLLTTVLQFTTTQTGLACTRGTRVVAERTAILDFLPVPVTQGFHVCLHFACFDSR